MKPTAKQIDAILPQTQCGLCTFNGCMPYAEALAEKTAAINLCPPGGVKGLFAIAEIVNADPAPYLSEMEQKAKPPLRAVIREAECIGCTKCIKACPVDAILGSAKQMHTIIADECTGCELCIAPCPVDCIDMVPASPIEEKKNYFRQRYLNRKNRLQREQEKKNPSLNKKDYLQAALLRAQGKKTTSQK